MIFDYTIFKTLVSLSFPSSLLSCLHCSLPVSLFSFLSSSLSYYLIYLLLLFLPPSLPFFLFPSFLPLRVLGRLFPQISSPILATFFPWSSYNSMLYALCVCARVLSICHVSGVVLDTCNNTGNCIVSPLVRTTDEIF